MYNQVTFLTELDLQLSMQGWKQSLVALPKPPIQLLSAAIQQDESCDSQSSQQEQLPCLIGKLVSSRPSQLILLQNVCLKGRTGSFSVV